MLRNYFVAFGITVAVFSIGMLFAYSQKAQPVFGAIPPSTVAQGGTGWNVVSPGYVLFGSTTLRLGTSSNLFWQHSTSRLGISSSTPLATLSVGPAINQWPFALSTTTTSGTLFAVNDYGSVMLAATQPATTTMILNWNATPRQIEYRIGTAASTITIINATTTQWWASTKVVYVCNPGSTAGALTWIGVEWVGTPPSQTTSANQCDVYSLNVTHATSSTAYKVAGAGGTGFQ